MNAGFGGNQGGFNNMGQQPQGNVNVGGGAGGASQTPFDFDM